MRAKLVNKSFAATTCLPIGEQSSIANSMQLLNISKSKPRYLSRPGPQFRAEAILRRNHSLIALLMIVAF